jgi:hypothetical protein
MKKLPESQAQETNPGLTRGQIRLYVAGYAVLVLGSLGAAWAYRIAVVDELRDALVDQSRATRDYQGKMEYIGGKANVLGSEMQEWFMSLWHGRNLAYTLAVLTIVTALLCFFLAFALPDLPPFAEESAEDPAGPAG